MLRRSDEKPADNANEEQLQYVPPSDAAPVPTSDATPLSSIRRTRTQRRNARRSAS